MTDQVTACTIVARNYLPAARVLARSYLEHHPDHDFAIFVIDADEPEVHEEGYRILGPPFFGIEEQTFLRMATAYSVTELATAVKADILRELRADGRIVIFFDPDIEVYAPMPELPELAREHSIVLIPHFLKPLPKDGREPADAVIMGTGIYNLGFIAVGPGSADFIDFWASRLRFDAIVAPERQLFTDQRWVDQVPALYPHHILTDPGFDVAYWNLHERRVEHAGDGWAVNGRPLRFFHFSGYRPEQDWLLTYHCARKPRILFSDFPELRTLCDGYGRKLLDAGYAELRKAVPYGFATFGDGTPLPAVARRLFRTAWMEAERDGDPVPPHAYGPDGGAALREWLGTPADAAQAAAGLNRLAMAVWESRTDLGIAFPHPCAEDAPAFRAWCATSGVVEESLPDWALPVEPPAPEPPTGEFGVNLVGYLTAELGLGEMGRIVHDAMEQGGVPVASVLEERSLSNRTGMERPETVGSPRFGVSVFAVNADQTRVILTNHPEAGSERYRIGLWAWELDDFPEWQHEAFGMLDEIWTISEFCRKAIAAHATVPVKTIPVPVRDPGPVTRAERVAGAPVRFLFAFDFNSVAQRKNPWGLVTAFQRAFPGRDDVRLAIKTINGALHPHAAERLRAAAAGDDRIELVERYLSVPELHRLYESSTCYVSLHRSEGFGLTVAEAMARALPVIATDYSGTSEFLDEHTGWPIPYEMVRVGQGCYPYHADAQWADPDLDAAAAAMREVADDPAEADRRGRAAREHILRTRPMATAAEWFARELAAAHRTWQERRQVGEPAPAQADEHPLTPLRAAREALRWRAETGTASRNRVTPALRKAVLRVLDHYDVHQRRVLGAVRDGTEETAARLLGRIEQLEATVAKAQRDLHASEEREQRLEGRLHDQLGRLDKRSDHTEATLDSVARDVTKLGDDLAREGKAVHERLAARDERMDSDENTIQQLVRDTAAVHASARLGHAPVPPGTEVVLCDAGALLLPADDVVLPWIAYHRSWEDSEAQLMAALAAAYGGTFLDIGAHVGYHTLRLLRARSEVTRVVAVEADATNASLLARNLTANLPAPVAERVSVLSVAAWDAEGEVRLAHAEQGNSGDYRAAERGEGVLVPAVRLDAVPAVTEERVGLVKVDLQGRDHRALAGLNEVLHRDQPHVVCEFCPEAIEELGDDPAQVLTWYRKIGYLPAPVTEEGPVDGEHGDDDLIRAARTDPKRFLTLWLRPS